MNPHDHPANQPAPTEGEPAIQVDLKIINGETRPLQTVIPGFDQYALIHIHNDTPQPGDLHFTLTASNIANTPQELADFLEDLAKYITVMNHTTSTTTPTTPGNPGPHYPTPEA